jgi:hypothetical protein
MAKTAPSSSRIRDHPKCAFTITRVGIAVPLGGKGDGPEEFGSLRWVRFWGDSLVAFDAKHMRLTYYTAAGDFLGTERLRPTGQVPYPWPQDFFANRSLLILGPPPERSRGRGVWHDDRSYFSYDLGDRTTEPLGIEYKNTFFAERFGAGFISIPILFGPKQEVQVHDNRIYEVSSETFQVRVYDSTGQLQAVFRKHDEPQSITAADLELAKDRLYTRSRHEAIREAVKTSFTDMPIPSAIPALGLRAWERVPSDWAPKSSIMIDDVNNVWVLEFNRLATDTDRWTVFNPDGALVGTLEFPPRFQPFHIGDDFLLGLTRDADGVETVKLYRIEKPRDVASNGTKSSS